MELTASLTDLDPDSIQVVHLQTGILNQNDSLALANPLHILGQNGLFLFF
jgi:hypothetical protein